MIRASIAFFLFGIFTMALGWTGAAGVSFETGRMLLFVFVALAVVTYVLGLVPNPKPSPSTHPTDSLPH